jgi:hypothetical protein
MKRLLMATTLLSCLVPLAWAAGPETSVAHGTATPIRPIQQCMVASDLQNWAVIDDRRLAVKTLGGRYYDIALTSPCKQMLDAPNLAFRSSQSFEGTAAADRRERVCGDVGDAVIPVGRSTTRLTCDIASMRRIDAATFDALFGKSPAEGKALLQAAPALASNPR